jgi:hypothetical protein
MRHWTAESRARHAELMRAKIKNWAPWEHSTGPKSIWGKSRSSQNAVKHGMRSIQGKRLLSLFARQRRFISSVYTAINMRQKSTNELIKRMSQKNNSGAILPSFRPMTYGQPPS